MPTTRARRPIHWRALRALGILISGVLVFAAIGWWATVGHQERQLAALIADFEAKDIALTLDAYRRAPVPDSENGAVLYREAVALLDTSDDAETQQRA